MTEPSRPLQQREGRLQRIVARLRGEEANRRSPGGAARGASNRWANPSAQREILTGLSLGGRPASEALTLWRALLWGALTLVVYQVQAGFLRQGGPEILRLDVAAIFLIFTLRLRTIEGVLSAFAVGFVADLFVQGPPGLCRFLAVAIWTAGRMFSSRISPGSKMGAVFLTFGASALFQGGIFGGLALVAADGAGPGQVAWLSVVPQALLAAGAALPIHWALARLERRTSPAVHS